MKAYLTGDLWREMAVSANATTTQLAEGLRAHNRAEILYPVDANIIFCRLPRHDHQRLLAAGAMFYTWDGDPDVGDPDEMLTARFVTDWSMTADQVARFLQILRV